MKIKITNNKENTTYNEAFFKYQKYNKIINLTEATTTEFRSWVVINYLLATGVRANI